jgi:putative transposase
MDKGYDYPEMYELLEYYGYTIHIPLRGEHRANCKQIPRYMARHWVVEMWMNRFRRSLIRAVSREFLANI